METPKKIVLTYLTTGIYLLWVDDVQRASFNEATGYGNNGSWFHANWYGPDARGRAELEANRLGDEFGIKVDKRGF